MEILEQLVEGLCVGITIVLGVIVFIEAMRRLEDE